MLLIPDLHTTVEDRRYLGTEHRILFVVLPDNLEGQGKKTVFVGFQGLRRKQSFKHVNN